MQGRASARRMPGSGPSRWLQLSAALFQSRSAMADWTTASWSTQPRPMNPPQARPQPPPSPHPLLQRRRLRWVERHPHPRRLRPWNDRQRLLRPHHRFPLSRLPHRRLRLCASSTGNPRDPANTARTRAAPIRIRILAFARRHQGQAKDVRVHDKESSHERHPTRLGDPSRRCTLRSRICAQGAQASRYFHTSLQLRGTLHAFSPTRG